MSFSTPDRRWRLDRHDEKSALQRAREEMERTSHRPAVRDEVTPERSHAETPPSAGGASPLLNLLEHERKRSAARRIHNTRLANRMLSDVVGDLDDLLSAVSAQVDEAGRGSSRQRIRDAVPRIAATSGLAALPFAEMADLLGLPPEHVEDLHAALAEHGGMSPADRHAALTRIDELRTRLQEVEVTRDHSLLDRFVAFIVRIALLVLVAASSAPVGALLVGESAITEVIKAGLAALVAAVLQQSAGALTEHRRAHDPHTAARAAHRTLLDELGEAERVGTRPAYDGEHAVVRIRLVVRGHAARMASIPVVWKDKYRYWKLLDDVQRRADPGHPERIGEIRRTLLAMAPPERKGSRSSG